MIRYVTIVISQHITEDNTTLCVIEIRQTFPRHFQSVTRQVFESEIYE